MINLIDIIIATIEGGLGDCVAKVFKHANDFLRLVCARESCTIVHTSANLNTQVISIIIYFGVSLAETHNSFKSPVLLWCENCL